MEKYRVTLITLNEIETVEIDALGHMTDGRNNLIFHDQKGVLLVVAGGRWIMVERL